MKNLKDKTPIIALVSIALFAGVGMGLLEMEGASKEALLGAKVLIWTINIGGIAMFWIAADIKQKNSSHGFYALMMAMTVRFFAYAYIAYLAGATFFNVVPQVSSEPIISKYTAMLMAFANTVILFCERFIHYYANPEDEYTKNMKTAEDRVKTYESKMRTYESKMKTAEDRVRTYESRIEEYENKLSASSEILKTHENKHKENENKVKALEEELKTYENYKPAIEMFFNKPYVNGSTYRYIDTKSMKAYSFNRTNEIVLEDGRKIKKPTK